MVSDPFTPAANDLLVVGVHARGSLGAGALTDSQGLGFTLIDSIQSASHTLFVFLANTLAAASSMTVTFTVTGDDFTACIIGVVKVASNAGVGYVQSKEATGAAASTPTVVMDAAINALNCVVGFASNSTNTSSTSGIAPPTNWTEIADLGIGAPNTGQEIAIRNSGETLTTVPWGSTSASIWHAIIVEFAPPAAGGQAPRSIHQFRLRRAS